MQAFSYVSPNALLKALLPRDEPTEGSQMQGLDERIAAFRQYIADKERRGSMQAVPEFPLGSTWFNASPLSLARSVYLQRSMTWHVHTKHPFSQNHSITAPLHGETRLHPESFPFLRCD